LKGDFDSRDLRRTVGTLLSSRGIDKEKRAHLLSHGLGGVQNTHYDRYNHFDDKKLGIEVLHAWLEDAVRKFVERHGDCVPTGLPEGASRKKAQGAYLLD
jgi:hypothetical protein